MECGWFMDTGDPNECRVPIAAEFHQWASWERRHDWSKFNGQGEGVREVGKHPRPRAWMR